MKHLILSLDYNNLQQSSELLQKISNNVAIIKIGHCLLSNVNKTEVAMLCQNKPLMLDLKFFDIPNTILSAVEGYSKSFPSLKYFTFYGNLDDECISKLANNKFNVKAVAVLILSSSVVNAEGFITLAKKNYSLGITNFICPPAYIKAMREEFGNNIKLFSPGIRGKSHNSNDHSQAMPVKEALALGGDFMIVGRPLLNSNNPQETIKEYL